METMDCSAAQLSTYDLVQGARNLDNFGVTIHKRFLSPMMTAQLRERLIEQAEQECERGVATFFEGNGYQSRIGKPDSVPFHQRIPFLANKGRIFIELAKHPLALAYANHVLSEMPFNVAAQAGVIIRNGAPAQVIHNDQQFMPFVTPMPLSLNIMVALGDYAADMGATRVVPGSHQWNAPDLSQDPFRMQTIALEMDAGDAAIWESRLWHGQGESTSDRVRYSIASMYIVHFMKTSDCQHAVIHDAVYAAMSDEERALYGFDYTAYLGRIGPRYPGDPRANTEGPVPFVPELKRNPFYT